jgi:DNA-binding LytR/AlgR family response regulator
MAGVLLVEDDFLNRRLFQKALEAQGFEVFSAKNVTEAKRHLETQSIELGVLDINLGENEPNGLMLGAFINEHFDFPIIYLTAYENKEIVSEALKTNPYAYLTKPFKETDLIATANIALQKKILANAVSATIQVNDSLYIVDLEIQDICYIESDGNYLNIHTAQNVYKLRSTLKDILSTLADLSEIEFIRVHRAFVVNKEKIEKYSSKSIIVNDVELPLSKSYQGLLRL